MGLSVPSPLSSSSDDADNLFKLILDSLHDGVYFTDLERRITYWNQAAEDITGYTAEEVVGTLCADNVLMHVDESGCLLCGGQCPLSLAMADGRPHRADIFLHHKNGHRVPAETRACAVIKDGKVVGAVEIFSDNSRQRAVREKAAELTKLAFQDPASQVANRRYLDQQLSLRIDQYSKLGTSFGIALVDVDKFKDINDSHGHAAGDTALVTVARTLSRCVRASDVLGRWGGDEFLMILPGISQEMLAVMCERCRVMVARSIVDVEGAAIRLTISLGGAMVALGDTVESLMKRADQNLYSSKQSGRNTTSL